MTDSQQELARIIRGEINENGGWVSFSEFMRQALYAPGLGYYEQAQVFGEAGDFITGGEMGPWLALGFSDLIEWGWQQLGCPQHWTLLEQGGGSGRLLCDVAKNLRERALPFPELVAVEASSNMRARQEEVYRNAEIEVSIHIGLDELAAIPNCLMICNELPDAFPVRCFCYRDGSIYERGVSCDDERFIWRDSDVPLTDGPEIDADLIREWPGGYISEWNPGLESWQQQAAAVIGNGYLFCVDYGYTRQEYYRPQRIEGSLLGHIGHQTTTDVLTNPGSMDLTAHIDFTALCQYGLRYDLKATCLMPQGLWLAQSPSVQAAVQQYALAGKEDDIKMLAHAKRMMLPFGMGEIFKLLIQAKGVEEAMPPYLAQLASANKFNLL